MTCFAVPLNTGTKQEKRKDRHAFFFFTWKNLVYLPEKNQYCITHMKHYCIWITSFKASGMEQCILFKRYTTAYVPQLCCLKLWGWFSASQPSPPSKHHGQQWSRRKWCWWFSERHLAHWVSVEPVSKCISGVWNIESKSWLFVATGKFIELLTRTGILTATSQIPDRDNDNFPPLTSLGELLFSLPLSWYLFPALSWSPSSRHVGRMSARAQMCRLPFYGHCWKPQASPLQVCSPVTHPTWSLAFRETLSL